MIHQFIHWFEQKVGVYLNPKFVISVGLLIVAAFVLLIVWLLAWNYTESVKTVVPMNEKEQADYNAKMRAGIPVSPSSR